MVDTTRNLSTGSGHVQQLWVKQVGWGALAVCESNQKTSWILQDDGEAAAVDRQEGVGSRVVIPTNS
jgi:hypothetical protein